MEIEEIRAIIPTDIEFVDLHREMPAVERDQYKPARFYAGDLLPYETLYNVFDGECVTHEIEGDVNAMGFIGGIPTHAVAEYNRVRLDLCNLIGAELFSDWQDAIMENFFGFEDGDVPELPTTIYDKQNDCLILCYKIYFGTIVLEFLQNKKYDE